MLTLERMIGSIIMIVFGFLLFYPMYYLDVFISNYDLFPLFIPITVSLIIVSIKSGIILLYSRIMGGSDVQDVFLPAITFSLGIIIMHFLNNVFVLNSFFNNISIFFDVFFIFQQTSIIFFSLTVNNPNKKLIYVGYAVGVIIHFFCKFSTIFFIKT